MDADLLSIYEARRAAESAWEAFRKFRGTDVSLIDEIVQSMSSLAQKCTYPRRTLARRCNKDCCCR